jgi:PadR family transcriptional regulator, regulatory protein AphA
LSTPPLKSWSYVVLALIGRGGAGPHELVDMMRRGGQLFYAAAPSQVYAESKRLAELGLVEAAKVPGRTREKTLYRLTEAGEAALREWLVAPTPYPRIQNEAHVRLLQGALVDDADLAASLLAQREAVVELAARLQEAVDALDPTAPSSRYLRLSYDLAERVLAAQRDWLAEVDRELGGP